VSLIQRLPAEVYRKIAAGEVIERPLSVVKELVENAIDAGSREISVHLTGGGREEIRVEDNGSGFPHDEIEVAFARHATSKLSTLDDLAHIRTLGFRGEALASMLEVAEVDVRSADNEQGHGVWCRFAGGRLAGRQEIARMRGASVTVRNLFGNLPVRRRFLKSDQTESGYVSQYLEGAALSHPEIAFSLWKGDRLSFSHPAARDLGERVYQVFGREFFAGLVAVSSGPGEWRLEGWVSRPGTGLATRARQFFMVNGRPVREKTMLAALQGGSQGFLEKGRYAACVLHLDLPPDEIDVNVHPMKLEIRFANASRLYQLVAGTIRTALSRGEAEAGPAPAISPERRIGMAPVARTEGDSFSSPPLFVPAEKPAPILSWAVPSSSADAFRVLGQFHLSYVVVERQEELWVVDQHNARERILFERLQRQMAGGEVERVPTLFPLIVELTPAETALLTEEKRAFLDRAGFEVDPIGERALQVRAYPLLLNERTLRDTILSLLHQGEGAPFVPEQALADMACHSAIKINQPLTQVEMETLIRDWLALENPHYCPHRRPIAAHFTLEEIEKMLRRR